MSLEIEKTDENTELQMYSYKQCTKVDSDELKAYRGVVVSGTTIVAPSLGYTPEYNETELDQIHDLDPMNYSFYPSREGTLLRVFFHNGKWYLSTHRKLDAFKSRWGSDTSFGDLFVQSIGQTFDQFTSTLTPGLVYVFMVLHANVCKPSDDSIYHIGTLLNNKTFDTVTSIGVTKQTELTFATNDDIQKYVAQCDPLVTQGLIAFSKDGNGRHLKLVNSTYQLYSNVRGNEPDLTFRFIRLLRDRDASMLNLFVSLYPQYKDKESYYATLSFKVAKYLHTLYFSKFVKKEKIECQQDDWSILRNVHEWFWADRVNRRVTFDIMHKMMSSDANIRSYYHVFKRLANLKQE